MPSSLQTNLPIFKLKESCVRRRYSDFEWLKNELERDSKVSAREGLVEVAFLCLLPLSQQGYPGLISALSLDCSAATAWKSLETPASFPRRRGHFRGVLHRRKKTGLRTVHKQVRSFRSEVMCCDIVGAILWYCR